MRILYLVGFTDWWGSYPPDVLDREDSGTIGGGETCALRTAAGLVERGHEVVYCSVAQAGEWRGVKFAPMSDMVSVYAEQGPWDALVAWRDARLLALAVTGEARLFIQQLNDLGFGGPWERHVDMISPASENHGVYLKSLTQNPEQLATIGLPVSNGCDPTLFPLPVPRPQDRPLWVGYWSSPDRGLIHLLDAWPRIKAVIPEARLKVYYKVREYVSGAKISVINGRAVYTGNRLERLLAEQCRNGVDLVDALPRRTLAREQIKCRVMTYPLNPQGYTEGFGQAVPEAMLAGCLPIVRCVDAFESLWKPRCWSLDEDPGTEAFINEIAQKTIWGLLHWQGDRTGGGIGEPALPSQADLRAHAEEWSWERSARMTEAALIEAGRRRVAA
jgi:glycosyltransferase involved in cell wall biosynthesis